VRRDLAALGPTPPTLISVPDLSARAQDRPAPREPLDGRAQAVVAALAEGRSLDEIAAAWNVSRAHIELIARLARRAAARETSPSSTGRQ
jgi:DNA-binding NarL/FixJ family response regulator